MPAPVPAALVRRVAPAPVFVSFVHRDISDCMRLLGSAPVAQAVRIMGSKSAVASAKSAVESLLNSAAEGRESGLMW
eukprot:2316461-Alexandrium_andersonii.AAC.1